jgi:hypothetical protein
MTKIPDSPKLLDNVHAPDFFADDVAGFFLLNGNVRITFVSNRVSHISTPGPVNNVVIGRLVMPIAAAESMARQVLGFIEKMKNKEASTDQGTPTIQ